MIIRSKITGQEYLLKTYTMPDGKLRFDHAGLQKILENQLEPGSTYEIRVLSCTYNYCAVMCTITDMSGRKVFGINDINTNRLGKRDPERAEFTKCHPLIAATDSAVDTAVRNYLGLPSFFADFESMLSSDAFEIVSMDDEIAENGTSENNIEDNDTNITESTSMDDKNANNNEENTMNTISNPIEDELAINSSFTNDINDNVEEEPIDVETRLAELGMMYAPSNSKYSNLTFDEIWDKDERWFSYILRNGKNEKYNAAKEYARLKGINS